MSKKKVLIIGAKGMLGQELVRVFLADENYEVIAWDRKEIDITDETQVKDKIGTLAPQIIVNAAAYNVVDKVEEPAEFELAKKLNGLAPGYLAKIAKGIKIPPACQRLSVAMAGGPNPLASLPPLASLAFGGERERSGPFTKWRKGAIFVHYSTDYVFDGEKKEGYLESDKPSPICNYGFSKLMGEQAVARVGGQYYIIRLQKLFGCPALSAGAKKSFFDVMLELAKTKKELEVVDEELANFTYAPDLAARTKWLVEGGDNNINSPHPNPFLRKEREKSSLPFLLQRRGSSPYGIYHITNEGNPVTWFGAAKVLFEIAGVNDVNLIPVSASRFPRPAKRPKYSILLNTKLPPLRPWPEALKEFLANR